MPIRRCYTYHCDTQCTSSKAIATTCCFFLFSMVIHLSWNKASGEAKMTLGCPSSITVNVSISDQILVSNKLMVWHRHTTCIFVLLLFQLHAAVINVLYILPCISLVVASELLSKSTIYCWISKVPMFCA